VTLDRLKGLLALALIAAATASAQPPQAVIIEELTWTELRDQLAAGKTTVIIPVGGTEQNGPAMVLGKHNIRVKLLSEKIALALGNALVAPVLAYVAEGSVDPPTAHMRFPGTITLPEPIFEKVLESAARSLKLHGFRDIVFLGDHGGYQRNQKSVADRLNREWAAVGVRVHAVSEYYRAAESGFAQLLRQRGYSAEEIGTHAGLADTSLALALDARLVRVPRLQSEPQLGKADGVNGDPRRSSAELGQAGVNLIVTKTVDAIRKATARH
jgi:creatinine amidohydrolase/Fe(II)-dependent formamide hydrolase-like protein